MTFRPLTELLAIRRDRRRLADDDVLARDALSQSDKSVRLELFVRPVLQPKRRVPGRLLELLHREGARLLLLVHVRAAGDAVVSSTGKGRGSYDSLIETSEETSVDGGLVEDDGIFLVVA